MDRVTIANTSTSTSERLHQAEMPRFGLGVYLMGEPGECKSSVLHALKQGYRLIDTAMAYGNEDEVGQAIRESGIPRENIFVVTKLRQPHANSHEETLQRCQQSLENLGLDYMDLYLIHAPPKDLNARASVWQGMEECLSNGWTRSIGVSNYGAHHLDAMLSYATVMPSVNQIEIAVSLGCTPAQAAIKWCFDAGAITIPKSSKPNRISENLDSLKFDLSGTEEEFAALEESYVSGWDPTSEP